MKKDFIAEAKLKVFDELLFNKYPIKIVSANEYWEYYRQSFRMYDYSFDGLYFCTETLTSDEALKKLTKYDEKMHNFNAGNDDCFFIMDESNSTVIGLFVGAQIKFDTYDIRHCVIHEKYRRNKIYTEFVKRILIYTKELGFSKVTSIHSPSNNPIIIANLKLGFFVSSLEIDHECGVNLIVTYFHNEDLKKAFAFRCGDIEISRNLIEASEGSINRFIDAIDKENQKI